MFNRGASKFKLAFGRHPKRSIQSLAFSEEDLSRYCIGGYHPVRVGDIFNNRTYKVLRKIGYGSYSTVWLVCDLRTNHHVALKILTADTYGNGHDTFELDILRHIRSKGASHAGSDHVLGLLDDFKHHGPHGDHMCLVSRAMGPDMSKYRRLFPNARIPVGIIKTIAKQLILALDFLHGTCGVVHTDIKPQNILLNTPAISEMFENAPSKVFAPRFPPLDPPDDYYRRSEQVSSAEEDLIQASHVSIRLADFGTASWMDNHLTEWIQPQMLRAPEVILGAEWNSKVDIWNVGLIIWELTMGALVFDGTWTATSPYTPEAHLAQMESVLGSMPKSLLARSKNRHRFFDEEGILLVPSTFPPFPLEQICQNPELSASEKALFLDFIRSMVTLEPEERLTARDLLGAQWLKGI